MVTGAEKELIAKMVREEPARVAAERRQEAHQWLLDNIVDVVKFLKAQVKKTVKTP